MCAAARLAGRLSAMVLLVMAIGADGLGVAAQAGPVYYVDFVGGNDASDGLTRDTAWRHLPGTRTGSLWQSGYVCNDFGQGRVVAHSRRVPRGTIFRLKGGALQDASRGGAVVINSDFYESGTSAAPIIIERDPSWGKGPVVFDGEGLALVKWEVQLLVHNVDNEWLRGNGTGGIAFRNSPRGALAVLGSAQTPIRATRLSDLLVSGFHDCGVAGDWAEGYEVTGVELDGEGIAGNSGFHFGEHPCNSGVLRRCVAHELGDEPGAQAGGTDIQIGFWLVNSRHVRYVDCVAYDNEGDGYDVGLYGATEENSTDDICYINCLSRNNGDGFGANAGEGLEHNLRIYYINCIAVGNNFGAFHAYGGTAEYFYTNVVAAGNRDANFSLGPDGWQDKTPVVVHIRNSIGYRPDTGKVFHKANLLTTYVRGSGFRLDSDCNYWGADVGIAPNFCYWDAYAGPAPYAHAYSYANGPGSVTSEWYALDEDGHLHCDGHSINGVNGPPPGFVAERDGDYRLAAGSALRGTGCDLSREPWYLPEMGLDREGRKRTTWNIGAY
jgi:hypothetical protein